MYCSIDDIIADVSYSTLAELSSDEVKGVVDESIVTAKIEETSDYIDTYLSGTYAVPYTGGGAGETILNRIATALTVCDLYRRRLGLDYPESLEVRRREAISDLEKIQKGIIKLSSEASETARHYRVSERVKLFLDDNLKEY